MHGNISLHIPITNYSKKSRICICSSTTHTHYLHPRISMCVQQQSCTCTSKSAKLLSHHIFMHIFTIRCIALVHLINQYYNQHNQILRTLVHTDPQYIILYITPTTYIYNYIHLIHQYFNQHNQILRTLVHTDPQYIIIYTPHKLSISYIKYDYSRMSMCVQKHT